MEFRDRWSKFLIILTVIVMWIYLIWRVTDTLPASYALIAGIILFLVEGIHIFQGTLFYLLLYRPSRYLPPDLPDEIPRVDLLIATYNESTALLQRTVLACKNLDYPGDKFTVWLCDDGRRPEVLELAGKLGIHYLDRPDNSHAKAGNLNNALAHTSGEFIVTLDADMLPKPQFLKRTIGFFNENNVAFVQTPQSFYNEDVFQFNSFQSRNIPNEQDMFMQKIQSGRDRFNAAIYVGSNTIFRRKALEAVGGFATGTITEDMATGMLIQAKGYRTIAYSEVLAQGLATESLNDLLSQRIRWARGTIQTMRKWNPLTMDGLTIMQRLLYVSALMYWYFGVLKLVFLIAPIAYLLSGTPLISASISGILIFWLPYFALTSLLIKYGTGKRNSFLWSNIYEICFTPVLAWAVLVETLTKKSIGFQVTPKGVQTNNTSLNTKFLFPIFILILLSLVAMIKGFWMLNQANQISAVLINLFWVIFNLFMLLGSVMIGYERPHHRNAQRFSRNDSIQINGDTKKIQARALDISETGCRLVIQNLEQLNAEVELIYYGKNEHRLKANLVYYDTHPEGFQAGFNFSKMPVDKLQQWILEVYGGEVKEADFKFEKNTGLFSIMKRYVVSFRKPTRKRVRAVPRLKVNVPCSIVVLSLEQQSSMSEIATSIEHGVEVKTTQPLETNEGEILDFSLNGCQFVIGHMGNVQTGETIIICIPHLNNIAVKALVVRVASKDEKLTVGVKFLDEETGQVLYRLLKNTKDV